MATTPDTTKPSTASPTALAGTLLVRVIVPLWLIAGGAVKLWERNPQLLPKPVTDVTDWIFVSGTTATHGGSRCVAAGDAAAQTVYILDKIAASLSAAGGRIEDVVRTRIYLKDASKWEGVSRAHGRIFGKVLPANTLIEARLVGDYDVEIEADAIVDAR